MHLLLLLLLIILVAATTQPFSALQPCYHTIQVLDAASMRGVPAVNLTTVNLINHYTDSNGIVAFFEPGLMGLIVDFAVVADGYVFVSNDTWFPNHFHTQVTCNERTVIMMKRNNIAQRLYRMTGQGIFADSALVGEKVPNIPQDLVLSKFLLNAQVLGQDSVYTSYYKGKLYWFWGDTNRPSYPLGNFAVTGATSPLPSSPDYIDPEFGINYTYFTDAAGFTKHLTNIPPQNLPTWIHGVAVYNDQAMYATYIKPDAQMRTVGAGILKWNETTEQFDFVREIFLNSDLVYPVGHAYDFDGYFYFGESYFRARVRKDKYLQLSEYESYTCLMYGTSAADLQNVQLNRSSGVLQYSWQKNTASLTPKEMYDLVGMGKMTVSEAIWLQLRSKEGEMVLIAAGTIRFNKYKKKFVLVGQQVLGKTSILGEMWYSEADSLLGPWTYAVKIVTHNSIDFYNPMHHHTFDKGSNIFFEGTFVVTFDHGTRVPRYDYNQQMYKLDLSDPLLSIPQPVYQCSEKQHYVIYPTSNDCKVLFYALRHSIPNETVMLAPQVHIHATSQNDATMEPLYDTNSILLGYVFKAPQTAFVQL